MALQEEEHQEEGLVVWGWQMPLQLKTKDVSVSVLRDSLIRGEQQV